MRTPWQQVELVHPQEQMAGLERIRERGINNNHSRTKSRRSCPVAHLRQGRTGACRDPLPSLDAATVRQLFEDAPILRVEE